MMIPNEVIGSEVINKTVFKILTFTDILQLAGLYYLLGALLKHILPALSRSFFIPILCIAIATGSPVLWGLYPDKPFLLIFWGTTEYIIFPFFPWVIYPLLGMYLSPFLLKDNKEIDRILNRLILIGLIVFLLVGILILLEAFPFGDYSRSGVGIHLFIIGFVFIWLKICRIMEKKLPANNWFIQQLTFLSVNITTVYFIQWLLFSWSILFIGANQQNAYIAALINIGTLGATYLLAKQMLVQRVFSFTSV